MNYRGSVGYGREWRDTLIGNIGGPELEDVNAGLADLVALGIADPERAVIAGPTPVAVTRQTRGVGTVDRRLPDRPSRGRGAPTAWGAAAAAA